MRNAFRFLLPAALAIALAACGKPADQAATAPSTDDGATATASATTASAPADSGFELTMDKVDAYYATIGKMSALAMQAASSGSQEEGEDADDPTSMDASESVDHYIARIEADPKASAMVTSAGMSVSDYAHTNEALTVGMMTAGALESGALKKIPDGIDPQYVEFAQQHKAELEAKLKALQAQFED
jgi:hypothetical protein